MPDRKISQDSSLLGANVDIANDFFPIVDVSEASPSDRNKKISPQEFISSLAASQSETDTGTEAAKYVSPSTHAGYHRRGRTITANDSIVQTDQDGIIVFNSATSINFTIDELLIKTTAGFINIGAGTVTFVNGTGVTIDGITSLTTDSSATIYYFLATAPIIISGGGGTWGSITGTLTDQTDLATALRQARNFGLVNINALKL